MTPNKLRLLKDKKIILICHFSATAFMQHLEEFLIRHRVSKLLTITHPLHPQKDKIGSYFYICQGGRVKKKHQLGVLWLPELLHYLKDVFLNAWWIWQTKEKWDLCIAANNLNAFSAIWLKKLGLVKKVVFYTVDFVPQRFDNKLLNAFYHWVEKFAVINADETWILSPRVREGRRKYLGLDKIFDEKQILVPEGVWIDRINRKPTGVNQYAAIFVGHLAKRMGVQIVIKAIPLIIKKIPDFKFIIIGKGNYRKELEKIVKKLKLEKHVEFKGYIKDHQEVEEMIASCAVGIATYTKDESGLTFYADPAKTKVYLGCSIPVVMTNAFYNAHDIANAGAGIVVKNNLEDITRAIINIIEDKKRWQEYKKNALEFAKQFDYNIIFPSNLERILSMITIGQYKKDVFRKMGITFTKGKMLLDVGCGDGLDSKIFIEKYGLKTHGIDIYKHESIEEIKKLTFKRGSIFKIPYKNNFFDYVFLHDVLHHINEGEQSQKMHLRALDELKRICKRGGQIIILEANRYNPLFYPHMVKMRGHNHFRQDYFKKIVITKFPNTKFKYFEAHSYPPFLLYPFKIFEFIMEKIPFFRPFIAYNLAIIKNE